jgi:3-oxoacyl-[acyl-carrier protein] reductase
MNRLFENQSIVITGGGRGIGKAIAFSFAEQGASIAICGTNESILKETASELESKGCVVMWKKADVSIKEDVENFSDEVLKKFDKVDILVNNAGIARDNLLIRMSEEEWNSVLNINLKGAFLVTKSLIRPMMKAHYGRIINIASVIGIRGNMGQANYAASKSGLIGFSKTIAREFATRNITCNVIAPGYIQTEMTHNLDEKLKTKILEQIPLGFLGESCDVSEAVLFLASKSARYITGQVLCVDGGMVI